MDYLDVGCSRFIYSGDLSMCDIIFWGGAAEQGLLSDIEAKLIDSTKLSKREET